MHQQIHKETGQNTTNIETKTLNTALPETSKQNQSLNYNT